MSPRGCHLDGTGLSAASQRATSCIFSHFFPHFQSFLSCFDFDLEVEIEALHMERFTAALCSWQTPSLMGNPKEQESEAFS